jgi:hypothetical protein
MTAPASPTNESPCLAYSCTATAGSGSHRPSGPNRRHSTWSTSGGAESNDLVQLLDHDSDVPESAIEQRVKELLPYHAGLSDCRVVAETEAMELEYLSTRDDNFSGAFSLRRTCGLCDRSNCGHPWVSMCAPACDGSCGGESTERLRLVASAGLLILGLDQPPFRRLPAAPLHRGTAVNLTHVPAKFSGFFSSAAPQAR